MVFVRLGWRYAAQVLLEDDSRWARSPVCGSLKARFVAAEGRGLLFYIHVCQLVPCVTVATVNHGAVCPFSVQS